MKDIAHFKKKSASFYGDRLEFLCKAQNAFILVTVPDRAVKAKFLVCRDYAKASALSSPFCYPTAFNCCVGIVFTRGIQMGGWQLENFVQAVF